MDRVIVLDFGSQTTHLISRRIRDLGVYAEVLPGSAPLGQAELAETRGIILSGSPESVYEAGSPRPDPSVYRAGLPVLGICYGLQALTVDGGGVVAPREKKEFGRSRVKLLEEIPLFAGVPDGFVSWMSHGDTVETPGRGYRVVARSEHGLPAALASADGRSVGIQFHPEVTHCEHGSTILSNYVFGVCGARAGWSMAHFLAAAREALRGRLGGDDVLLLISGGVDSTVVGALLLASLDPERVHFLYVDTGLMRKNESEEVMRSLGRLGARHLHRVDAEERFLGALHGVSDPEEKRRLIGDEFIRVQQAEVARLGLPRAWLAQGTLYVDMIESGKGVGKQAHVIKSHHNVRSPLVEEKRRQGRLVEPLAALYKDEVRKLGAVLGLEEEVIHRHPFPGPGLGVRILGEVTREKCDLLREADAIFISELRRRGLYRRIWQAFCVLLPVRSVGVAGDARRFSSVLALRAITSTDGMTADVFPFPMEDLVEISSLITNSLPEVSRVVYDVSSKPPATIEWE
jgi:GMP synthase (glutamine-hydrolysing)